MHLQRIKAFTQERFDVLRSLHAERSSGLGIACSVANTIEEVICQLYQHALEQRTEEERAAVVEQLALVAVAGFGRRDVAPHSDVDVWFLHRRDPHKVVLDFIKVLVRDIWDVGFELGQNVGTVGNILALSKQEVLPGTALIDARYLLGQRQLHDDLVTRYRRHLNRGGAATLYEKTVRSVASDQEKFGTTSHLLEPDVKKTVGGLRDLHLIHWLGSALYEAPEPHELERRGLIGTDEARILTDAHDFLLRVRIDLHLHAGKAADVLLRSEQMRIAKEWGYHDSPSMLAVEQFMRDYFRRTTAVEEIVQRFVARSRPRHMARRVQERLVTWRTGKWFRVGPLGAGVIPRYQVEVFGSLACTLELARLASLYHYDFEFETLDAMREVYGVLPHPKEGDDSDAAGDLDPEAVRIFLELLKTPGGMAKVLRRLHEVGVLERLIPEFEHARCLLQFNAYHKYTVDEHTFVMLGFAEELVLNDGLLGRVYEKIKRLDLLHLAILLHDVGKGYEEDHSKVGARITRVVAERFGFNAEEHKTVVFLVEHHLLLSQIAFHRDITDKKLLIDFARTVGTVERLRMLYVLTVVDVEAVGPGTMNQWRADILADLFRRTARLLGEEHPLVESEVKSEEVRRRLAKTAGADERAMAFLDLIPNEMLEEQTDEQILAHWRRWQDFTPDQVAILNAEYRPAGDSVTLTVVSHEETSDASFSLICGALTAHNMEILSARIRTLGDKTILDQFDVKDKHHTGPPTPERCRQLATTVRRLLAGELKIQDVLWSSLPSAFVTRKRIVGRETTQVVVDSKGSEEFTIIEIFTPNRRGLLYTMAKSLHRLGLRVHLAKIATYSDEVVDVFYVQENDGRKVDSEGREKGIKEQLVDDIHRLADDPRSLVL
ncbi:Bifunctional uridylyltransferase/uridylyl-removing enzyme [Planctomycetes bacterium Pan216]|uniref:Bifunctional uridylyltransferase/uridylyl-removing enzyme n=1 Tax=Kolteria novifilia TaxID=2527975 RepID=A0A518B1T8_9BACT|nr:Bifunctional uridylyltransferase/uridylyl-removing enzyme [Planctomycetes bacterium Pan216]